MKKKSNQLPTYSTNQKTWEILNLWYKDQYEEIKRENEQKKVQIKTLQYQLTKTRRTRDMYRIQTQHAMSRVEYVNEENQTLRRLISEIFEGNPEIRQRYEIEQFIEQDTEQDELSETESEDMFYIPPVARRLDFN